MKLREVLATNLKRFRLAAGLSQEELAHRAHLDRTYVSSLERGRYSASIDKIENLSLALGIEASELLVKSRAVGEA
jgi:transcriptional regulator with XRE-family HTH domain